MDGMTEVIGTPEKARNPRMKRFLCTMAAASVALIVTIAPVKGGEGPPGECGFCWSNPEPEFCPEDPFGYQEFEQECDLRCGQGTFAIECYDTINSYCGDDLYIECGEDEL